MNGNLQSFLSEFGMPSGDIDDEVLAKQNGGVQIITDRRKSCPNSYGVSEGDTAIMKMLLSYHWFNSQQIRNTLNDIESGENRSDRRSAVAAIMQLCFFFIAKRILPNSGSALQMRSPALHREQPSSAVAARFAVFRGVAGNTPCTELLARQLQIRSLSFAPES